jgi:hypothetical protein
MPDWVRRQLTMRFPAPAACGGLRPNRPYELLCPVWLGDDSTSIVDSAECGGPVRKPLNVI